jgi:hypothetical protein
MMYSFVIIKCCHPGQAEPNASSAKRRAGIHSDSRSAQLAVRSRKLSMGPGSRCAVQARLRLAGMTHVGRVTVR